MPYTDYYPSRNALSEQQIVRYKARLAVDHAWESNDPSLEEKEVIFQQEDAKLRQAIAHFSSVRAKAERIAREVAEAERAAKEEGLAEGFEPKVGFDPKVFLH